MKARLIGDETFYKQKTFKLSWHCDNPDTDDEDGPTINQQSSTRMLILKAVRKKTQQIQKLEEKSQNVMKMVKSTANCLNICYQTIWILILINCLN